NNSVGSLIRGNRVRNLTPSGSGSATGILVYSTGAWVRDNLVGQQSSTNGIGISCGTETRVRDNIVKNYTQGLDGLCDNDTDDVGVRMAGSRAGGRSARGTGHLFELYLLAQYRSVGIEFVRFVSGIRGYIVAIPGDGPLGGIGWGIRALGGLDVIDIVVDGIF